MAPLRDSLNLDHPIIQAPMAGVSTPAMAAAACDMGALGSIAVGAMSVEAARSAIRETRELTKRPFNVNVFLHESPEKNVAAEQGWLKRLTPLFEEFDATPPAELNEIYKSFNDDTAMQAMFLEEKPAVVSFHFGVPHSHIVTDLKAYGAYLIGCATCVEEAIALEKAGMDAIVAQGMEAGGHRGIFKPDHDPMIGTMALVPQVVDATDLPIIAAGGITDGRGIAASLMLGAEAAQMGTAFVASAESAASAAYKTMFLSDRVQETEITCVISGRPARGIKNRFMSDVRSFANEAPAYPNAYDAGKAIAAAAGAKGNNEFAAMWAGQAAKLARKDNTANIIAALAEELEAVLKKNL